jgi:DNA-binding transcriptional ArsR family regulator
MILPLARLLSPQEVVLISGRHGKVVEAEKEVVGELKARGVAVQVTKVEDWDVLAWSNAITAALDRLRDERVTVNVTAGHGLAISMLAIHAAQRGLPVACYDWEPFATTGKHPKDLAKYLHPHSPAAVLNLGSTQPVDRAILRTLLESPMTVGKLAKQLDMSQSTISTSLARLVERGFLDRRPEGKTRIYGIRDGLHAMISHALA